MNHIKMFSLRSMTAASALGYLTIAPGAFAGPTEVLPPLSTPPPMLETDTKGSRVSGTLSLDYNSHFMSYGADVWGAGNDLNDALFNPMLELVWDLGGGWSFKLGTWWDVNDNIDDAEIGNSVQEVDVWAGVGFTTGIWSFGITYQEWMFGGESERIIDLSVAIDTFLNPSLTVHTRIDAGALEAGGSDTGAVFLFGVEEGFDLGPVAVSVPLKVAFATDEYHAGDSGFAYASIGLQGSLPISFISEEFGDWSLNAGLTYYYTDDEVIPGNPDDSILTANVGVSVSF